MSAKFRVAPPSVTLARGVVILGLDPLRARLSLRGVKSPPVPVMALPDLFWGSPGQLTRHGADSGGPAKPHMHRDKSSRGVGIAHSASCSGLTRASVASGILDNLAQCTLMEILGSSPRMTMESKIRRPGRLS